MIATRWDEYGETNGDGPLGSPVVVASTSPDPQCVAIGFQLTCSTTDVSMAVKT